LYGKYTSVVNRGSKYISKEEIAVRNFIKVVQINPSMFNLPQDAFYNRRDLMEFINSYNNKLKYSLVSISQFKNRNVKILRVQKSKETEMFMDYVKARFVNFDQEAFYELGNGVY